MNTRSPARQARAQDRVERRASLLVLLDRVGRLSPTEAALLREYTLAELAEADERAHARRGLDRARDRLQRRLTAAEAAIVEAENDRDQARQQLAEAEERIRTLEHVDIGRTHGAARVTTERDAARDDERHARAEARETRGLLNAALVRANTAEQRAEKAEASLDQWAREADALVLAHRQHAARHHAAWRSATGRARHEKAARKHAQQRARTARSTLDSIRNARTWVDVWAHLGMHYVLTPEQVAQEAKARRTVDERIAHDRADELTGLLSEQATKIAQLGQPHAYERKRAGALVITLARERKQARKNVQRVDAFRRRAKQAEATLAAIRTPKPIGTDHPMYALLDAMVGPGIGQTEARELVGEYFRAITQQEPTP